ncbi:MAG: hypothetical protein ACO3PB_08330 [Miltoncostaeaceae bacterium]
MHHDIGSAMRATCHGRTPGRGESSRAMRRSAEGMGWKIVSTTSGRSGSSSCRPSRVRITLATRSAGYCSAAAAAAAITPGRLTDGSTSSPRNDHRVNQAPTAAT